MEKTKLDELFQFLDVAQQKGFINGNTTHGRRTACTKLFSVLDEDQKNVEYVAANLQVMRGQFQKLNPGVMGTTVEEYARRVQLVLTDFQKWTTDRPAWEREVTAKGSKSSGENGEKRARPEKLKGSAAAKNESLPADTNTITVPLGGGSEAKVTFPKQITYAQVKRIAYALVPYATDWDPDTRSQQQVLPMQVERDDGRY